LSNASNENIAEISNSIYAILYHKNYEVPKEKKAISLDGTTMKQYEGEYEMRTGLTVKINAKDSVLIATPTGQGDKAFFAEKKDLFFEKEEGMQLEFVRNDSNQVDHFVLHQAGRQLSCKKIK